MAGEPAAPLVDAHAHIYHSGMPVADNAWHTPPGDALLEDYIAELDKAGVRFAVLAAASIYGDYNDYTLEAVRAHKRLRGTVIVEPDIDPYSLRAMDADGIRGIRFQWRYLPEQPDLSSYSYRRLLRRVADLGWHVHLHDNSPRLPGAIAAIEASGARLVIDHFGRPDPVMGIDCPGIHAMLHAVERGKTWVKVSGAFRAGTPQLVQAVGDALIRNAGPDRLFWGSDWPFASFEDTVRYADTVEALHRLAPSADDRRRMDVAALAFYFPEETA